MCKQTYKPVSERIVRVKNDAIWAIVDKYAMLCDIPHQDAFDEILHFMVHGETIEEIKHRIKDMSYCPKCTHMLDLCDCRLYELVPPPLGY